MECTNCDGTMRQLGPSFEGDQPWLQLVEWKCPECFHSETTESNQEILWRMFNSHLL
jgi:hypothetical protein